jgi:hypothetical protein
MREDRNWNKGDLTDGERQERWKTSLNDLSKTVPADKIFLLQIPDAYRMQPPINNETKDGMWSRSR